MLYTGYFNDINEIEYKVEIITDNNTTPYTEELLLEGTPVKINYVTNTEQAYKPYKCSTATITLLLKRPIFDLNNAYANRVKVTIYKENKVFWCGFATPNAYSQDFNEVYDEFELECQDGISTLQYFYYDFIAPYGTYPTKLNSYTDVYKDSFVSNHNYANNFLHIIDHINSKIGYMYKNIYVTNSIVVEDATNISCLDAIFIDEKNFFDEDGIAWKCINVLEEICKYTGLTCFTFGNSLYFLNQDAICRGFNDYYYYSYDSDNKLEDNGIITLEDNQNIGIGSFSNTGVSLSLDSIFNKVSVKDDLYTVDNIVPDYSNNKYWVESEKSNYRDPNDGNEYKWDDDTWTNSVRSDNTIVIRNNTGGKHWVFLKHYGYDYLKDPNQKIIFKYYNKPIIHDSTIDITTMTEIPVNDSSSSFYRDFTYGFTRDYIGAEIIEYGTTQVEDWYDIVTAPTYNKSILLHFPVDVNITSGNQTSFNYFTITNHGFKPIFECITESYFMGENSYIVIDGQMTFSWFREILPFMTNNTDTKQRSVNSFVWCKLQVGNKWLVNVNQATDSTSLKDYSVTWSTTEGYFKLPLEYTKDNRAFNTAVSFKNTVDELLHISETGYVVKCPESVGSINKIKFIMMIPHGIAAMQISDMTPDGTTKAALLDGFSIKVCNASRERLNDSNSNTEISNTIDNNAISEYNSINLKICSNQDKRLNLSQTFYVNGVIKRSSILYAKCSFVNDDSMISTYKISELLRYNGGENSLFLINVSRIFNRAKADIFSPEQNIISNIVEQYDSPTLNIECNLKNSMDIKPYSLLTYDTQFPNYRFCIDSMSYDLRYNSVKVKMISKKYEYDE